MAYEEVTYEAILQRMIERIKVKYPNLDIREGSLIFDALAPAALELAVMYTELDNTRNESFVKTASREYILIACEQMGMDISVFEASAGVHKGEFNAPILINSRWNCDLFNYRVTEYIGQNSDTGYYEYKLLCESEGTSPNSQTGDLTPINDAPADLTHAKVVECLIEGENETSDDDVREAYFEYVNSTVSDGNKAQYERWCSEYEGVGNAKVFPLWNGANTVKVSILSASNTAASPTLVEEFQNYIDPGATGMGDGQAPIGAFVTVTTASEIPINVSATITMKSGYDDTSGIATALQEYFSSIAYEKSVVAYMNVGAVILNVDGVESINNLKLNNSTADVTLGVEEIPVLGTVDWTVS